MWIYRLNFLQLENKDGACVSTLGSTFCYWILFPWLLGSLQPGRSPLSQPRLLLNHPGVTVPGFPLLLALCDTPFLSKLVNRQFSLNAVPSQVLDPSTTTVALPPKSFHVRLSVPNGRQFTGPLMLLCLHGLPVTMQGITLSRGGGGDGVWMGQNKGQNTKRRTKERRGSDLRALSSLVSRSRRMRAHL